jgi:hypothetical protein
MRAILLLLALVLTACAVPARDPAPAIVSEVTLTPAQSAALEARIREKLKDPGSAQFGKRIAGRNELGSIVVCGLVNARNSFGGYTGMGPYLAAISPAGMISVELISSDDFSIRYIGDLCAKQGLQIIGR